MMKTIVIVRQYLRPPFSKAEKSFWILHSIIFCHYFAFSCENFLTVKQKQKQNQNMVALKYWEQQK